MSMRLFASFAAKFKYKIYSHEITLVAYIYEAEKRIRQTYVKTAKDLNLNSKELIELIKLLYRTTDANDY